MAKEIGTRNFDACVANNEVSSSDVTAEEPVIK